MMVETDIKLNLVKCGFQQEQLEHLDHETSSIGIRPDKRKIQEVENFPDPRQCIMCAVTVKFLTELVFYFTMTTSAEQPWRSFNLQTFVVVNVVKRFRVCVMTIARWWMILQEDDTEIKYNPSTNCKMQHVETLSRNLVDVCIVAMSKPDLILTV
ncbi:hypothetical protein ABEB36_010452 [Hypothenemus hampei]|uniref:Uncharacterized protein n=1 Tax=Hypothenemus hampei TaxID=57062 RepID=A0ABD1EJZ6_HYPHA